MSHPIEYLQLGTQEHPEVQRLVKFLNKVDYHQRKLRWQIEVSCDFGTSYYVAFRPVIEVEDVQTGATIKLYMPLKQVRPEYSDEFIPELIYLSLLDFERHELDEHFFYEGVKVHDPHKNDPIVNVPYPFGISKETADAILSSDVSRSS